MNTFSADSFAAQFEDDFGPAPTAEGVAKASAQPIPTGFTQSCPKCRGTGNFVTYTGRILGQCFTCKGAGKMTFKSSPAQRADNRAKAQARKVNATEQAMTDFAAQHPSEFAWLGAAAARSNGFAISLLAAIGKFGSLTEKQLAVVTRIAAEDAAKDADRASRAAAALAVAKVIDMSKIEDAFAKAHSAIKSPKLRIGDLVITRAKATSANAGALYVKSKGNFETSVYFGKIMDGKFLKSRDCDAATEAQIVEAAADPKAAAIAYGRRTGECAICGRLLTNHASIDLGIGPICAGKWGW
jgi:ribosome-binding protein aMBF1 (putative translation factor)